MVRVYHFGAVFHIVLSAFFVYSRAQPTSTTALHGRQDPGPTDAPDLTTTSMDWGPYPAYQSWGENTATSITDPATLSPATSFMAAVSLTTVNDAATGLPSTTISDPTATVSLIHITALPAAKTPRRVLKRPARSSFNIAYLAPLFAVIGIAAGMLLTWLIFFLSRGRGFNFRSHSSIFQPGPKYAPPSVAASDGARGTSDVEEASSSHFLGGKRQSRKSSRDPGLSRGTSAKPRWLQRGVSKQKREGVASSSAPRANGPAEPSDAVFYMEDDPFLAPPSDSLHSSPSSRISDRVSAVRSPFDGDVFSDREDDDAPYDTLHHKSIRRNILDRLKYGSHYRGGHKKADSDVRVDDLTAGGGEYSTVPLNDGRTTSQISSSARDGCPLPISNNIASGPGFRIVQEDTEAMQSGNLLGLNWTLPWIAAPDKLNADDKFTALPSRRNVAERMLSPSSSKSTTTSSAPSKDAFADQRTVQTSITRLNSSVLPTSPPRVTSPPLEAQLFFGAIPPKFGNTPQLDFVFKEVTYSPGPASPCNGSSRSKTKKLQSRRGPPLLPFPGGGKSSPYTNRLTKTPTLSPSAHARSVTSVPASPTKERHVALDRVDEIVAKSWGARDLRGEDRVGSPTMFGAVTQSERPPEGIEQRLLI